MKDIYYGLVCAYGGFLSGVFVLEANWGMVLLGVAIVTTSLIDKKVNG